MERKEWLKSLKEGDLVAREKKGQLMVLVHDAITGEEYGIIKESNS